MNSTVSAGFPSPAGDYKEEKLDLNQFLINHPVATYFIRVSGDSMMNAGILDGDILIVDRSLPPANHKIIIAEINNELTVKRLKIAEGQTWLIPENDNYKPILISPDDNFMVWGVITGTIRKY